MYDAAPGEVGQLRLLISKIESRRAQLQQQMQDIEATLSDLSEVENRCRDRLSDLGGA